MDLDGLSLLKIFSPVIVGAFFFVSFMYRLHIFYMFFWGLFFFKQDANLIPVISIFSFIIIFNRLIFNPNAFMSLTCDSFWCFMKDVLKINLFNCNP